MGISSPTSEMYLPFQLCVCVCTMHTETGNVTLAVNGVKIQSDYT